MSEQPRQKDGKFDRKLSIAPSVPPVIPDRAQIARNFDEYNQAGANQEKALSEGLHEVGASLDAIAEIYRERIRRREKEIVRDRHRLARMREQLDEMSRQREQVEAELKAKRERNIVSRLRKFFARRNDG